MCANVGSRISKHVLLVILDGIGLRANSSGNAVTNAQTPTLTRLLGECPNIPIDGSGLSVGLPAGQMGNSEVGHLNIGAGRIVYQDITHIDRQIATGEFYSHTTLCAALKALKMRDGAVHLLGLASDGCVHSSPKHLLALLKICALSKAPEVYIHAFTDGRDTAPTSGIGYLKQIEEYTAEFELGTLATVMGRYWAMDRDRRWERTRLAYDALVKGEGSPTDDIYASLERSYKAGVTDEFVKPLIINQPDGVDAKLKAGDLVICFNFRADRMRQICYFLCGSTIKSMPSLEALGVDLLTMTNYGSQLKSATVIYPRRKMDNILGELISNSGMTQLRISETEKYPHVTFFFNGGRDKPYEGEDRILIPSPKVATYDLQPEMSCREVTDRLCEKIRSKEYDLIILNYGNCDMVGHTGSLSAATKAVEAVDTNLARALKALDEVSGDALITADHGNCEQMYDPLSGGPYTAHTTNLVPLIFYGPNNKRFENPRHGGRMADIAPTILELLGIAKPKQMTGESFSQESPSDESFLDESLLDETLLDENSSRS